MVGGSLVDSDCAEDHTEKRFDDILKGKLFRATCWTEKKIVI